MAAVGFDWIFFAIVAPWPILALWSAFAPRPPLPETRGDAGIQTQRRP